MAIAMIAVAGSAAATAASAGGASPLVYLTGTAAVGASLQCGVAIGRMWNVMNPYQDSNETHPNDILDNSTGKPEDVLRKALIVADVVGLLDAGAATTKAIKGFAKRLALSGGNKASRRAAAKKIFDALPANERAKLAQEVAEAMKAKLTPEMLQVFVAEGHIAGLGSKKFGAAMQNVLRSRLNAEIGKLGFAGASSAQGGWIGKATGSSDAINSTVRKIVAHVFQDGSASLSPADGGTRGK